MSNKTRYIFFITLALGVILSIIGALLVLIQSGNVAVFSPKGAIALEERNLIINTILLMLIVVIPVFILIFSFTWIFRADNTEAKYTPNWTHNPRLELMWWLPPFLIIAALSVMTWKSTHQLDPYRPIESSVPPITIEVVALDWKWLFIYPDQHIATVNFVEFPVNTPVNFLITGDAPMNSFWIPQLGGQIYAMAGMRTQLHLIANEEGSFNGSSANYSGRGFSGMKFIAKSTSQNEFDEWLASVKNATTTLSFDEYNKLREPSENNPVAYYRGAEQGLFDSIIMKYMAPRESNEMNMSNMNSHDVILPQ